MLKVLRLLVVLFFVTAFSFIASWSVLSRKDEEEVEKPYQQTKEELLIWNYGEEDEEDKHLPLIIPNYITTTSNNNNLLILLQPILQFVLYGLGNSLVFNSD